MKRRSETGFLDRTVVVSGETRKYVVYVPEDYDASVSWPAILFLHGSVESGRDGLSQLFYGLGPAILRKRSDWPFVALFPQKADFKPRWISELSLLREILAVADRELSIDPARRYLTGLSQGGNGTVDLARELPWTFAALAPICGWADDPAAAAKAIGSTPVWAFHGDLDKAVLVERSIALVSAIERRGGNATLTRYPDVAHECWDKAYSEEALAEWFLRHRVRKRRATSPRR